MLKANQMRIIEQMVQLFAELFYKASIQLSSSNIYIDVLACLVHINVILFLVHINVIWFSFCLFT